MTPEELYDTYEYLAKETLFKAYKNPKRVAKQHRITYEDLLQYAKTGVWKSCISWDESKSKFTTYTINRIKWEVNERLKRECYVMKLDANKKYSDEELLVVNGCYSLDYDASNSKGNAMLTFHEIVPSKANVEEDALGSNFLYNMMKLLNDRERKMVKLRMDEKTNAEIGEIFGMTGSNVQVIIRGVREKLSRYLNMKEVV